MQSVSILGMGRLGGALAFALSDAGYSIEQLIYRSRPHSELSASAKLLSRATRSDEVDRIDADVLIICVADKEIEAAAGYAAPLLCAETVVLHTSGALSSSVLSAASREGNPTGSMHPLVSVSSPRTGSAAFGSAFFCLEGNASALKAAEGIARSLGGRPFSIAAPFKPLYHAAAVLASGHLVALFQASVDTLAKCGLDGTTPSDVLLPLVNSTLENLKRMAPEEALTGPFGRADVETIDLHLEAFNASHLGQVMRVYLELGMIAVELAERKNAPADEVEKIREKIKLAQGLGK